MDPVALILDKFVLDEIPAFADDADSNGTRHLCVGRGLIIVEDCYKTIKTCVLRENSNPSPLSRHQY